MRMLIALTLFYSAPAVTEQEWQGWQSWMVGQPCSTKTDIEENTCHIGVIEFKKHGRKS